MKEKLVKKKSIIITCKYK